MMVSIDNLKYDERGLLPAVVQDSGTGEVLTVAYVSAESLRRTIEHKETWFWSRSRNELWHKGATSGHTQRVIEVRVDCDHDAVVILVEPAGPACHTGERSCFFENIDADSENVPGSHSHRIGSVLEALYSVVSARRAQRPKGSYTTYLFDKGLDKILKKVGEECAETIIAAKNPDTPHLTAELSDLLYHLVVLMNERDVNLNDVAVELAKRSSKKRKNESRGTDPA